MLAKKELELFLSCEKGLGLGLREISAGKVLIVAGGTGLLPFSDIIDLIFKDEYAREHTNYKKKFTAISPVLSEPFLEKTTFHLIASFNSIEDIHKLTLLQLIYLNKGKRLRVTMKLSQSIGEEM